MIRPKFNPLKSLTADTVFDAIKESVLITDAKGRISFLNNAYCRMHNVTREEVMGRRIEDVRPPPLIIPTVLATGCPVHGIRKKKGENEYLSDVIPIKEGDRIVGVISISLDVCEISKIIETYKQSSINKYESTDYIDANLSDSIIYASASLEQIIAKIRKIAQTDSTVLILGETGTGKDLIARAIHTASNRQGFFIAINCAAMLDTLLESELFGYEAGSFTGANQRGKIGLFEVANLGTIFLDEIADMNLNLQGKILKVIEDQTIRKLGSTKERHINLRIIAATNKDLREMINEKTFRADLYYRLNVIPIHIPPLRERKEDIIVIAQHYLGQLNKKYQRNLNFTPAVIKELTGYNWPGNVRELKNAIEYVFNIVDLGPIDVFHLPFRTNTPDMGDIRQAARSPRLLRKDLEVQAILNCLDIYGYSTAGKSKASEILGISLATLYRKLRTLKPE